MEKLVNTFVNRRRATHFIPIHRDILGFSVHSNT